MSAAIARRVPPNMLALLQTPLAGKILDLLAKTSTITLSVLRLAPTAAKYCALLLLVLNAGSFPLVWHLRVWSRVFELRFALLWHRATHFYLGKQAKKLALREWYESRMPVGVHPFRAVWTHERLVGFDDADFNLHMSNSSYAKALDSARFRLALATFPNIFRCGGWVPLAATHFHFIREIPMLSRYEVRTTIGAWDGKWIWCISRFVKPPSKKSKSKSSTSTESQNHIANGLAIASGVASAIPTLKTPATPLAGMSGGQTPLNGGANGENVNDPDSVSRALLARAAKATEPDGALLYTVAVSQLCYKQGRITVPPAVVLAANGFYAAPGTTDKRVQDWNGSSANTNTAPPHWPAVRTLTAPMRALAKFYAGGWRDVPEGQRFWEDAFAACEAELRARLVPFVGSERENEGLVDGRRSGLSGGLEGVRALA
ncbi:hypothetical protein B0H19DRAFT_994471 [Mycena capillaripes]|nr:hypothetical protein B0H19DRAFT_994471 [Mycena capillaripes]